MAYPNPYSNGGENIQYQDPSHSYFDPYDRGRVDNNTYVPRPDHLHKSEVNNNYRPIIAPVRKEGVGEVGSGFDTGEFLPVSK